MARNLALPSISSLGVVRTRYAPSAEEPLLTVKMYQRKFSTSINSLPDCCSRL
jgi:hypothetical protein